MNQFEYSFFFNKKIVSRNAESTISLLTELIFNQLNHSSRNISIMKLSLNNILTNIVIAYLNNRYLIVSKSPNEYTNYSWYGLNHFTYRLIVGWFEILIKERYLNQVLGYYNPELSEGVRTKINANEKLITTLNELKNGRENFSVLKYSRNILLKDNNKRLIKYFPSGRLLEQIKFLNEYNEFISGINIYFPFSSNKFNLPLDSFISFYHLLLSQVAVGSLSLHPGIPYIITLDKKLLLNKKIDGQLYRVFNDGKFTRGGRFYGSHYQQLNEDDRAKIIINNSPIVEVDFSAFHLNMLYNLTGKQFSGDPYSQVHRPEIRPILKVLCLIVINLENKSKALKALREQIRKNLEFQKLKRVYRLDEKDLLRKFESVHSEISNYFYSGIGLKLMYKDSEIAESVLKYFTKREIPCLCVHDSFLVQSQYKDELKSVMNDVYKKHIGFEAKLK